MANTRITGQQAVRLPDGRNNKAIRDLGGSWQKKNERNSDRVGLGRATLYYEWKQKQPPRQGEKHRLPSKKLCYSLLIDKRATSNKAGRRLSTPGNDAR